MMRQEGEKKNWCMKKEIRVKCTRCERKERSRGGGKNEFQQINIKSNILSTLSKQISL